MDSSHLPRFARSGKIGAIQLTSRDRQIIQLVYRHRFVRSNQIADVIHSASQPLVRRLQRLFHHGYLERPRAQLDYYHQGGSRHIVYGLGNKGARLLSHELGIPFGKIRWSEKNRSVGRVLLEHTLLVSDFMINLEKACQENGSVRLVNPEEFTLPQRTSQSSQPFRWRVKIEGDVQLGIIPDKVFALEYSDRVGGLSRTYFLLEADRGTMPIVRRSLSQTCIRRKLLAYEATWSQAIHSDRFGFHRFRVLTITPKPKRLKSLIEACSGLRTGHGLFLFANWTGSKQPLDIFAAIWHSAKHGISTSLLN